MKKINRPRTKHYAFATMMFRAAGDDWFICAHNPNNKQAAYFLAEPTRGEGADKHKIIGYFVSGLERAGESEFRMRGLPRKFKDVETASEWIEEALEDYAGDEFKNGEGFSELKGVKPTTAAFVEAIKSTKTADSVGTPKASNTSRSVGAAPSARRPSAKMAAGKRGPLDDILDGTGAA